MESMMFWFFLRIALFAACRTSLVAVGGRGAGLSSGFSVGSGNCAAHHNHRNMLKPAAVDALASFGD